MREHKINSLNNFICGYYAEDTSFCDALINYHTMSLTKREGVLYGGVVDKSIKDSIDVDLLERAHGGDLFFKNLNACCVEYTKKYPMVDNYSPWRVTECINIQYYKPEAGFHAWHTERSSSLFPNCSRHMVFITYLNDVNDSGETEFYHQQIKIKPEKGLTILFPVDWTFTHRGVPSKTQEKYIITGWFNFFQKPTVSKNGVSFSD